MGSSGTSEVMYISGVPGIGKTVSTKEAVTRFMEEWRIGVFRYLNCAELKSPEDIYQALLHSLTGKRAKSRQEAINILDCAFLKGALSSAYQAFNSEALTREKVLVLDEIDFLMTSTQGILYNLFNWNQSPDKAKLIIIAIANTIDFPEQLKPKICSRIGRERLVYKTYTSV
jgi:origin recognition complex subunit 1